MKLIGITGLKGHGKDTAARALTGFQHVSLARPIKDMLRTLLTFQGVPFGRVWALAGQSMPTFWLGIMLIQVFAVLLGWLPAGGYRGFRYWILPAITIGYHSTAGILRLTRSAMLDVLSTDFVRLARIKGVAERLRGKPLKGALSFFMIS